MSLEFLIYSLLFILIGLMLASLFLVWHWFDAREQLAIVRDDTREETLRNIRHGHNKCRALLYINVILSIAYVIIPVVLLHDYYNTLVYPGVVFLASTGMLIGLRMKANEYRDHIDDYIAANEEHVREAAEERIRQREEWRRDASRLNPIAKAQIEEALGDNYETWYQHDILLGRNVLANTETGVLYAQGIVIPFSEIMEVRQGRKDLKLVTSNSTYPFITIDFGALPINPETGNRYKDEIAERIEKIIP